jgi:uncharacterized protein
VQRRELLTWEDVEALIDHLVPQFETEFEAMIIITRGGIIPGGILCEVLDLHVVLTAAVDFPYEVEQEEKKLLAWPRFVQFPDLDDLKDRKVLVVDDVWGSGRTITAVKNRVSAMGGKPSTCVLHYNPYRNLFSSAEPDYYAAITDVHVVYPWEMGRGPENVLLDQPDTRA